MASHPLEHALQKALSVVTKTSENARLCVGLSGGIDSVALLFACKELVASLPNKKISLCAIHVNHGLSADADDWQQHVTELCDAWNIPLRAQQVKVSSEGSLEEAAREARYDVFKGLLQDQDFLLLGHHQDDQIETMMQRLMRGSGLSGLLSMRSVRVLPLHDGQQATVLRPFLSLSKSTIEDYAKRHHLAYVEDDSNLDEQFDRNFWRLNVLPLVATRYPQYRQSMQASLDALQEAQSTLQYFLQQGVSDVSDSETSIKLHALGQFPRSIQQQILRHWLQMNQVFPLPSQRQLVAIIDEVVDAKADADPRFQWRTHVVARFNGRLYLLDDTVLSIDEHNLPKSWQGESLDIGFAVLQQTRSSGMGLKPDQYQLVWGNPGHNIRPLGRPSKTFKKLMQESNIPPWYRSYWPILLKQGEVAAIPNVCICEGFAQSAGWQLEFKTKLYKK